MYRALSGLGLLRTLIFCCALVPAPGYADLADLLEETTRLRQAGDAVQAWTRLRAEEPAYAGEPDFDMQLGFAALEAGHPEHAVFAFERVLLARPWDERARLEMARAAYLAGNYQGARESFQRVLDTQPPERVRSRVDEFLAAIDRAEKTQQADFSAYVDMRIGRDSNVNSATASEQIDIPALGVVTLDASGREDGAAFMELSAGATLVYPFSRRLGAFAEVNVKDRVNQDHHASDLRSLGLSVGPVVNHARQTFRVPLTVQELYLDDARFRHLFSIGPEWRYDIDPQRRVSFFAQAGGMRYPDDKLRDVRLLMAGASWTQLLAPYSLLLVGSAYIGDERAEHSVGAHNGRNYTGARLDLQWQKDPRHTPYLSVLGQWSKYDADNPVFLQTRDEDFVELKAGWNYRADDDWSWYAEASHARNHANVDLYDYTRTQFSAGVRYVFD